MSRITHNLVTFQTVVNHGFSKISQVREGGGSQNLGTVPKLYLVINYEGFPNHSILTLYRSLLPIFYDRSKVVTTHRRNMHNVMRDAYGYCMFLIISLLLWRHGTHKYWKCIGMPGWHMSAPPSPNHWCDCTRPIRPKFEKSQLCMREGLRF